MAEWETIVTRKISGKGVLKVPPDKNKIRAYVLFGTVVRKPTQEYNNYTWNPPRSRYASISFLRQGYVLDTFPMEYERQVWDGINDVSGQTLIAVKCAYDGVLESIFKLSALIIASNPVLLATTEPVSITDLIKDYENLRLSWDEMRVQCYADTAIEFKMSALKYDVCNLEKDRDKPPPPPPPPVPPVPPGQPILDISPPYQPSNEPQLGDNNNTQPHPTDIVPLPPPPPPGTSVELTVIYDSSTLGRQEAKQYVTTPYFVWHNDGQIEGFYTLFPSAPYGYPFNIITAQGGMTPPSVVFISATDTSGYPVDVRIKPQ